MRRTALVPLLLALGTTVGHAQEPLTLEQAIAWTLAGNPAVHVSDAGIREAAERVTQARAGYLPRVNLVESWQRSDQPVFVFSSLLSQRRFTDAGFAIDALNHPDAHDNFRTAVAVEQPVFDGTRTATALRAARLDAQLAELDRAALVADLRLAVTRAYGQVLQAEAARAAADAAVAAAEEDLRRAERRRDAGFETDANVLALAVHLAEIRARQIGAASDEDVARVALNQAMGVALTRQFALAPVQPAAPGAPLDAATLESDALARRPELQQAGLRRELAEAGRLQARASRLPHVAVQAGVEFNGGTFADRASAWLIGTQVTWSLFAGDTRARVREATHAVARAEAERARLDAAVRVDVRSAVARLEAARAREAVGRAAVEQARESQRILRDRYDAGLAPASDLLRANLALLDAETIRVSTLVDVTTAAAALDRAIGRE